MFNSVLFVQQVARYGLGDFDLFVQHVARYMTLF